MVKFRTDFDPEDIPEVKDAVYTCRLGGLEITEEPSEKGYYMAVIRNTIDEGPVRGETIWDRIIVRHATGAEIPLVARRRMKKFLEATGGKIHRTDKGTGIEIPDNARYGVQCRSDSYGPKANDYFHLSELGPASKSAEAPKAEAPAAAPEPTPAAKEPEPDVSFDEDFM